MVGSLSFFLQICFHYYLFLLHHDTRATTSAVSIHAQSIGKSEIQCRLYAIKGTSHSEKSAKTELLSQKPILPSTGNFAKLMKGTSRMLDLTHLERRRAWSGVQNEHTNMAF